MSADAGLPTDGGEETAHGLTKDRVDEVGGYLDEGDENEGALMEARVGEGEGRSVKDEPVVEEEIEVESAGGVLERPGAVEVAFDVQQRGE